MPVYEFQCTECAHTFDCTLKIADSDKPKDEPCPNCGETGHIVRYFGTNSAPKIGRGTGGAKPIPTDFRNKLENIKKFYKNPNINEYGVDR